MSKGKKKSTRSFSNERYRSYLENDTLARSRYFQQPKNQFLKHTLRQLFNENPHARRAVDVLSTYLIGSGIIPHGLNQKGKRVEKLDNFLKSWADSTQCDIDGLLNLYGIQQLVAKTLVKDGEILILKTHNKDLKIPLQLRLLECDHLDPSKGAKGIELDNYGRRIGYHLFLNHPEDTSFQRNSVFVAAKNVLHIFRPDRPSQLRGTSWITPILNHLTDFSEYESSQLLKQKLSSYFVGVYRDLEVTDIRPYEEKIGQMSPGTMMVAPPGQTIEFSSPPSVEGFDSYVKNSKLTMSSGISVPYMLLTCDYSNTSYSSARMEMMTFYKYIEAIQNNLIISRLCTPIAEWFLESLELVEVLPKNLKIVWALPKKDFVDPVKEVEFYERLVGSGFASHSDVLRELGRDPEEVYQDIHNTNEILSKFKIHIPIHPERKIDGTDSALQTPDSE